MRTRSVTKRDGPCCDRICQTANPSGVSALCSLCLPRRPAGADSVRGASLSGLRGGPSNRNVTSKMNAIVSGNRALCRSSLDHLHQAGSRQDSQIAFDCSHPALRQARQLHDRLRSPPMNEPEQLQPLVGQDRSQLLETRKPDLASAANLFTRHHCCEICLQLPPRFLSRADPNDHRAVQASSSLLSRSTSRAKSSTSASAVVKE